MGHAIHDFTGKLRQPAVLPLVLDYVNWRRGVRRAEAAGETPPAAPSIAPISNDISRPIRCGPCRPSRSFAE